MSYRFVKEASPLSQQALERHPLVFVAGAVVWAIVFCAAILALPRRLAMAVAIAVLLGHAWGASTWVFELLSNPYWTMCLLFLASCLLVVLMWESYCPPTDAPPGDTG